MGIKRLFAVSLFVFLSLPAFAGQKIAFVSNRDGNNEIYVMNVDGSNQSRLTFNPSEDEAPALGPNGSKIAFASIRDGNYEIYLMNADGSNQTNLTNNPAMDYYPSFSPDGSKIAFYSQRDGNFEIYVMNADGSNLTRLTNNTAGDVFPAFSFDGSKIVFSSLRDGNNEIYVMNANGSNQTRLTNNSATEWLPEFSPDGSKIVFVSVRDGNNEIYVMNAADGSNQIRLTSHEGSDEHPTFSPDGSKIAFSSNRDLDGSLEVYTMNPDGSNVMQLTNNLFSHNFAPHWGGPTISLQSDVSISITDSPDPVAVAGALTYTLSITNIGPSTATNVTVTDTLPSNVAFTSVTSSQGTCSESSGIVSCDVGSLDNGATASVTINVTSNAPGSITNTATVSAIETDPNTSNNTANVTTTVNGMQTDTSVSSNQNPSVYGQSVTFTATVTGGVAPAPSESAQSASAGSASMPIGTVQFYSDGAPLGVPQDLISGVATISTSNLTVGARSITATYSGDSVFNGSTSANLIQNINKANTGTIITSHIPNPTVVGQPYTVSFMVAAVLPGSGIPTGIVTVMDATGASCAVALGQGMGSCIITSTSAGFKSLTAAYGGDSSFNGNSSVGTTHQVFPAGTTATLTSNLNPSISGQVVTFQSSVVPVSPGAGTPTGTVTFRDGSNVLGSAPLLITGHSFYQTSALTPGTHNITTTFTGDNNFTGSTSPVLVQTVVPNDEILFASNRDDRKQEIYKMNADGSNVRRLTFNDAIDWEPVWSPDRKKIAFSRGGTGTSDIYVMDADGTNVTPLTTTAVNVAPAWSPDGTKIVFASNRGGILDFDIYVMNANGTGVTRLTSTPAQDNWPAWSPDGSRIVFASSSSRDSRTFELYAMNTNGTNISRLTNNYPVIDYQPKWSPDGTKIVFFSNRAGLNTHGIYVMNKDGSGATMIGTGDAPSWGRNGKIVFELNGEIYSMNSNGSGVTQLTTRTVVGNVFDLMPNW